MAGKRDEVGSDGEGIERVDGRSMKWKPMEQRRRAKNIMGIEMRRMRRRPIRSISMRAAQVRTKFVTATERDVRVGEEKPRMVKIVALKYIREFCEIEIRSFSNTGLRGTDVLTKPQSC